MFLVRYSAVYPKHIFGPFQPSFRANFLYISEITYTQFPDLQQCAGRQRVLKKSGSYLLLFIFIGGLLGSILGEILQVVAPQGTVQNIFVQALNLGLDPPVTVNLVLIKFTLGFLLKMNLLTVLGMFLGAYVYKHI